MSDEVLRNIMKDTIPQVDPAVCLEADHEAVLEKHEKFFRKVIGMTSRLNPTQMARVALDLFRPGELVATHFGTAMSASFSYVRSKKRQMTSGAKLSTMVRNLIEEPVAHIPAPTVDSCPTKESSPMKEQIAEVANDEESILTGQSDCIAMSAAQIWSMYTGHGPPSSAPKPIRHLAPIPSDPISVASSADGGVGAGTAGSSTPDEIRYIAPDLSTMTASVIFSSGASETSKIEKGPDGFGVATVGGIQHSLEVPNVIIDKFHTKPKKKIRKRPASTKTKKIRRLLKVTTKVTSPVPAAPEELAPAAMELVPAAMGDGHIGALVAYAPDCDRSQGYGVLYYKNSNRVGIRQRFPPTRQIFSFGGKKCGKTEAELRSIGTSVADKIKAGEIEEADAKMWVIDSFFQV